MKQTVYFYVNPAASLALGHACPVHQPITLEFDPADLSDVDRRLIAARLNEKCQVLSHSGGLIRADAPTVGSLVQAIMAETMAATAASTQKERVALENKARIREETLNALVERRTRKYEVAFDQNGVVAAYDKAVVVPQLSPDWPCPVCVEVTKSTQATQWGIELELQNREAVSAALAEREAWIRNHGSPRLRRMFTERIECQQTYLQERERHEKSATDAWLAATYPGWRLLEGNVSITQAENVDDKDFAILDAARKTSKLAKLGELRSGNRRRIVAYVVDEGRTVYWPATAKDAEAHYESI